MTKLLMLGLPAIAIIALVGFKLPPKAKDWLFKVPVWLSATAISWGVGHFMVAGVMGPYAILVMDLVLCPAFWFIKKAHLAGKERRARKAQRRSEKPSLTVLEGGLAA